MSQPDGHRHQWSVAAFRFTDDRPVMLQRCRCGEERSVPAWDRSWTPPAAWQLVGGAERSLAGRRLMSRANWRRGTH